MDFAEGISATTTTTTAATATDRRLLPPPPPLPLLLLPIATWLPYLTSEPRKSPWTSRPYGCAAFFDFFGLTCTHAMNHPTTTIAEAQDEQESTAGATDTIAAAMRGLNCGGATVQPIPHVLFWQHTPAPPAPPPPSAPPPSAPLDPPAVATASSALSHGLARLIWTARVSTSAEGSGLNYPRSKTPSFRKSTATRQRFDR